jgi:uncharacterized protein YndB with AHSA1/START domain
MTESARATNANMTETSLTIRRQIGAPPEDVFDAWTDPEGMRQWMRPGDVESAEVSLDVRVGGRYTIDMIKGDIRHKHHGEYRIVDRPRKLAFTWNADWIPGGSLVTVELRALDGGTELILTHESLPDRTSVENHTMGWGSILDRLAEAVTA